MGNLFSEHSKATNNLQNIEIECAYIDQESKHYSFKVSMIS
jgi:hypothetical protein